MKAKSEHMRLCLMGLGWLLLIASPIVGILPGPGGVFVAAAGLILLLRNSGWVRRRYVEVKRRWPKLGDLLDKVMRRPSFQRRRALRARHAD